MNHHREKDNDIIQLDLEEVRPTDTEHLTEAIELNLDVGKEDACEFSPPLTLEERVTDLEKKMNRVITLLEYLAETVDAWKDEPS